MNWPLMRRSTYRREVTRVAQAYRWERDEAQAKLAAKERALDQRLDSLVRTDMQRDFRSLRILLDCDDLLASYQPSGDEYQRLAQRIVLGLSGLSCDRRGDMRQTPTQRMLA